MCNFLTIDRSITVGHIDGGYLYRMPNFIPFKFKDFDFGRGEDYKLKNNRLKALSDESLLEHVDYTGEIEGYYKNEYVEMEFTFIFESGLLRERILNKFIDFNS